MGQVVFSPRPSQISFQVEIHAVCQVFEQVMWVVEDCEVVIDSVQMEQSWPRVSGPVSVLQLVSSTQPSVDILMLTL
jgi:hypothetical protein